MERVRALIAVAVFGFAAPGCIHIHMDGDKDKLPPETQGMPGQPGATPQAKAKADSAIKQVAAFLPTGPFIPSSLPKMMGKTEAPKEQAIQLTMLWQNRVAYLEDPTRNGALGAGIAGQVFLFGSNGQFSIPTGPLTIELFAEPQPGQREPVKLGQWKFEKEVLTRLKSPDERFGPCYGLFLPWPDYRADITRVRLKAKYEPEGGFPIYGHSLVTFDTSAPGSRSVPIVTTTTAVPVGPGVPISSVSASPTMNPMGGPPPGYFPATGMGPMPGSYAPPSGSGMGVMSPGGGFAQPPGGMQPNTPMSPAASAAPQYQPMPIPTSPGSGPMAPMSPAASGPPPGMPPLTITIPRR